MAPAERNGITVAGTVIVDKINEIGAYPAIGELTQITGLQKAIGGCVPNVALDLKKSVLTCPSAPTDGSVRMPAELLFGKAYAKAVWTLPV